MDQRDVGATPPGDGPTARVGGSASGVEPDGPGDVTRIPEDVPRLPGDLRPSSGRRLDRPPGERLAVTEPPPPLDRPSTARAIAGGIAGWALVTVAWFVLGGVFGLDWGMAVVAAAGGWLIGALVARGAWGTAAHVRRAGPRLLAAALALAAWLCGQVAVYLWTRLALPDSRLGFAERVAATPFPAYFGGIFGPLEVLEVLLIATVGYLAAR